MDLARIKAKVPWYLKVGAKLLLSSVPAPYQWWRRMEIFKHGEMEAPEYAYGVFRSHFQQAHIGERGAGFVCLELGPGDSAFSAVIARAHGAARVYLVDAGAYASRDLSCYQQMYDYLVRQGHMPTPMAATTFEHLLQENSAEYLTAGVASLAEIPDRSVDWIWSQAVLEHIRKRDVPSVVAAMRRVLKPTGICTHIVDLRDHLGGGLNNLRFSEYWWENERVAQAGFYTNRLGIRDYMRVFADSGFDTELCSVERWPVLPIPRDRIHAEFAVRPEPELLIKGFAATLRPQVR